MLVPSDIAMSLRHTLPRDKYRIIVGPKLARIERRKPADPTERKNPLRGWLDALSSKRSPNP